MARKDGTYQIGVVLANSLWDTNTKTAIADTTGNVTLTFASPVTVTAQRPSVDDVVTTLGTAVTSLTVVADGKMTLLKIS